MTSDQNTENTEDTAAQHEPKGGHPGPVDEGKDGGMATRELAPDLTEEKQAEK